MTDSTILVSADSVSLTYGDRQVLQNISINIAEKQIVTLIGPNGAGKSSLLKIILGLLDSQNGQVYRRPGLRIGYMPQRLHVDPSMPMTVKKFLLVANPDTQKSITESLEEVGALHLIDQQIHGLSGGELQRVLLARALIRDPELLVLDEPVQGVDVSGQTELYRLIDNIRDQHNCGVLLVSHDLHLVMSATDEVICLNHHICCHGHPEQVSNDPAYLELFGRKEAETLAVYTHHHNHSHDISGDVVGKDTK